MCSVRKYSNLILIRSEPFKTSLLQRIKLRSKGFTGLLQYLFKFIPNLSDISAPLRKLEGNVE